MAVAAPATGNILVLGDSLSSAYAMETERGWVERLRQRLQQQGRPHDVFNASVPGQTTAGGLAMLDGLLSRHRPAIVVVELGGNDGLRGLPLREVRSNLSRIIETTLARGAKVLLIPIEIPPNYGRLYTEGLREIYRDLAERYGVQKSPFILEGIADKPERMLEDGIHPRAEAQEAILENVWPSLLPLL
ncbi:MAG: arylesterase [Beggiatoa sp.]|nr:arylesterase [Beggiatoa sp.]